MAYVGPTGLSSKVTSVEGASYNSERLVPPTIVPAQSTAMLLAVPTSNIMNPTSLKDSVDLSESWQQLESDCDSRSAAILAPTTWGGMIALVLLDELGPERRRSAQHSFTNWQNTLAMYREEWQLTDSSGILLEFGNEEHLFTFGTLCRCLDRFAVTTGWKLFRLAHGYRGVAVRLMLFRSDSAQSWGGSCPYPPPAR